MSVNFKGNLVSENEKDVYCPFRFLILVSVTSLPILLIIQLQIINYELVFELSEGVWSRFSVRGNWELLFLGFKFSLMCVWLFFFNISEPGLLLPWLFFPFLYWIKVESSSFISQTLLNEGVACFVGILLFCSSGLVHYLELLFLVSVF